jgi:hypothetical protein
MFKKYAIVSSVILSFLFLVVAAATKAADQAKVADVLILKGSPFGPVKFTHKEHADKAGGKCETCHHASKPEKPATAEQQACRDCHTKPPQAGMKTGTQAAFHNPMAKAGTCIDCHVKSNAAGKTAPTTCVKCHNKANV